MEIEYPVRVEPFYGHPPSGYWVVDKDGKPVLTNFVSKSEAITFTKEEAHTIAQALNFWQERFNVRKILSSAKDDKLGVVDRKMCSTLLARIEQIEKGGE